MFKYLIDLRLFNKETSAYDIVTIYQNKETNQFSFYYRIFTTGRLLITNEDFFKRYYPFKPDEPNYGYGNYIVSLIIKSNREKKN